MLVQDRSSCGDGEECWTCWTGARKGPLIHPSKLRMDPDVVDINRLRYRELEPKVVKWILCGTDM